MEEASKNKRFEESCKIFSKLENIGLNEEKMFLHILECLGALSCIEKTRVSPKQSAEIVKRRIFWHAVKEIADYEIQETRTTTINRPESLAGLLELFPDESKLTDGRLWLPLHFAAALTAVDPTDFQILFSTQSVVTNQIIDPSLKMKSTHLAAIMKSPQLHIIRRMRVYNPLFATFIDGDGRTPLHEAACYSSSVDVIEELISMNPAALTSKDKNGFIPIHGVKKNLSPNAAEIFKVLLSAAPETVSARRSDEILIHYFLKKLHLANKAIEEVIPVLLEADRASVNVATSNGFLAVHYAAEFAPLHVFRIVVEANMDNLTVITPLFGSVAHWAAKGGQLDNITYIHSLQPQLLLSVDGNGGTPLQVAVRYAQKSSFIKALYALCPEAVLRTDFHANNVLHSFMYSCDELSHSSPLSEYSEILRFLLRVVPGGAIALNAYGQTPYNIAFEERNSIFDYYLRLLLLAGAPSLYPRERKELNYRARKGALFAFFGESTQPNIFSRIRGFGSGEHLIKRIISYL